MVVRALRDHNPVYSGRTDGPVREPAYGPEGVDMTGRGYRGLQRRSRPKVDPRSVTVAVVVTGKIQGNVEV